MSASMRLVGAALACGCTIPLPVSAQAGGGAAVHELSYEYPAERFEETLVLGNGRVGASIFGGVSEERIYLNDATLWAGGPVDPYMNPDAHEHLPSVREALAAGDWRLADERVRRLQVQLAGLGDSRAELTELKASGKWAEWPDIVRAARARISGFLSRDGVGLF